MKVQRQTAAGSKRSRQAAEKGGDGPGEAGEAGVDALPGAGSVRRLRRKAGACRKKQW